MTGTCRVIVALALLAALRPLAWAAADPSSSPALAGGDYVWWHQEKLAWRDRDGGMRVLYSLNLPPGARITAEPEVFYRSSIWRHRDEDRTHTPQETFYRKEIEKRDGRWFMEVYSGEAQRFEVWARVELDGRPYYAQTRFSLGGSSELPDPGRERIEGWPDGPALTLRNSRLTRARLEEEISVRLTTTARMPSEPPRERRGVGKSTSMEGRRGERSGPPPAVSEGAPRIVSVFDQTGGIMGRPELTEGFFNYTPPYDQKLASGGYRGRNHIVFVARLPEGAGVVTYYLPVHRNSQHSHSSVFSGVVVALATGGICLIFVGQARWQFSRQNGAIRRRKEIRRFRAIANFKRSSESGAL